MPFGAIEAGGTKFVCAVGSGPHDLDVCEFPTTAPAETIVQVTDFFRGRSLQAIGIGSFGPIDPNPKSPTFGYITSTPKTAWRRFNFVGAIRKALDVPVAFETDVNAAAFGENRWGAAGGLDTFLYLTIGTGIGGGAMVNGSLLHGRMHPEMGHIRIPHDWNADPYAGCCPFHGDCIEGLASGPAMEARCGVKASELPQDHPAWDLEAHYLALGLVSWICTLSPQRIILGGGVMRRAHVFPLIRNKVAPLLNGYLDPPEIVPPELGPRAGVLGALALAQALG